jgi:hypothetical protein
MMSYVRMVYRYLLFKLFDLLVRYGWCKEKKYITLLYLGFIKKILRSVSMITIPNIANVLI